jgi:hypothetical protein
LGASVEALRFTAREFGNPSRVDLGGWPGCWRVAVLDRRGGGLHLFEDLDCHYTPDFCGFHTLEPYGDDISTK